MQQQKINAKTVPGKLVKLNTVHSSAFMKEKLLIKDRNYIHILDISNIMYCKADGSYTTVYFKDGTNLLASRGLKDIEREIKSSFFFRIHSSYLVNLNYLERIDRSSKRMLLQGNIKLQVSRARMQSLLELFS